jgi:hypothetical protein
MSVQQHPPGHNRQLSVRERAESAYRKYRNILILTNTITAQERRKIDAALSKLKTVSRADARRLFSEIQEHLRTVSHRYGVKATGGQLEKIIRAEDSDCPPQEGHYAQIAKFDLDQMFTRYDRVLPIYSKLPPHARIFVDVQGLRTSTGTAEFFQLEASLFEDMAALWNATLEKNASTSEDVTAIKLWRALIRATAKAAFNFLEGYLNGLAIDIISTQKVSPTEFSQLVEWDLKLNRSKPLSLRQKLLAYPRICLNKTHPVLDENNCPEIKKLLELEQIIRHALIHPNMRATEEYWREEAYLSLSMSDVSSLCDMTIVFVRKISKAIKEKFGPVDRWLFDRKENGYFPEEAFR